MDGSKEWPAPLPPFFMKGVTGTSRIILWVFILGMAVAAHVTNMTKCDDAVLGSRYVTTMCQPTIYLCWNAEAFLRLTWMD